MVCESMKPEEVVELAEEIGEAIKNNKRMSAIISVLYRQEKGGYEVAIGVLANEIELKYIEEHMAVILNEVMEQGRFKTTFLLDVLSRTLEKRAKKRG